MRRPGWTLLLLACSPALFLAHTHGASAAAVAVRQAQPVVGTSTGATTILVTATVKPRAICTTTVNARRARATLAAVRADVRGRVGWLWLTRPTSPSGPWTIVVTCDSGGQRGVAARRVVMRPGSSRATGTIGDPTSLRITAGTLAATSLRACGPFRPGQECLAWRMRKDVYDAAVARGVPRGGARSPGPPWRVWDGGQWLVNAQRGGLATGAQPVAGALVVWGVPGSASTGHIAFVRRATSDTHVLVSECGFDWSGRCRTAWRNPKRVGRLQGYVYRGPAQGGGVIGGPGAPPSAPPTIKDPPRNTALPTFGPLAVGTAASATSGTWASVSQLTFGYLWQSSANGTTGWSTAPGAGAGTSTYTPAVADAGRYLRVHVTANNAAGSASADSAARVVPPYNSGSAAARPAVSGTAQAGRPLTASTGTWQGAPSAYAYQWQVSSSTNGPWGNASGSGAATNRYTVPKGDQGKFLRVQVTASNAGGASIATSLATAKVAPPPPPAKVAWWHMDETSGGTMVDSSGKGNNGALHNVVLGFLRSLPSDYAYTFNGVNSYVDVPAKPSLDADGLDLTIQVDVNIATTAPNPPPMPQDWDLVRKGVFTTQGGEFKVEIQRGWLASCGFKGSFAYAEIISSGPPLNDGLWHTIKCAKTSSSITLTVDGVSTSKSASVGDIANNEVVIVGSHAGVSEFFDGLMDEVSITIGGIS